MHGAAGPLARPRGKLSAPGAMPPGDDPVGSRHLLEFSIIVSLLQVKHPS
jgi:hypothetical protein